MFKKVNIKPQGPIFTLKVPVTAPVMGIQMSIGDIALCLHARALVTEVLDGGKLVKLNLSNYDKDNSNVVVKEVVQELPGLSEVVEGVKKDAEPVKVEVKKPIIVEMPEITTAVEGVKVDAEPVNAPVDKAEVKVENADIKEVVNEGKIIEEKKDVVIDDVKSIDGDPKYFKEVERQKNKIKK